MQFTYTIKLFLFFGFIILFFGCKTSTNTTVEPSLDKDKMKAVLTDLYLAEAAAELNRITSDSTLLPHKSNYFVLIFTKHNITQQQYEDAYEYYTAQPEILLKIYEEIESGLELIEDFKNKKAKLK